MRPTLALLRAELTQALRSDDGSQGTTGTAKNELPSQPAAGNGATVRELRAAYTTWFIEARTWLDSMFVFGLRLDASGDPHASQELVNPEDRRRLEKATLEVLFLDGDPGRNAAVNALAAVIGTGDAPPARTIDQHRAFGRRCIAVSAGRLKELEAFQQSVAGWLTGTGI